MQGNETVSGFRLRVYDSPDSGDRYTVVFIDRALWGFDSEAVARRGDFYPCLAMNASPFHPQGFGQHADCMLGGHLGRRIPFATLPADCQRCVMQDLDAMAAAVAVQREALEAKHAAASAALRKVRQRLIGDAELLMNLTPAAVKSHPDYAAAKREYNAAFIALRKFNAANKRR